MTRIKAVPWLLVVLALVLCGCAGIKQDYPAKHYYALDVPPPTERGVPQNKSVLQVVPFRASPQAQGRFLIYRTSDLRYETDYYNEFLVPPETMLSDNAREFMSARGLFGTVFSKASLVFPDYVMEGLLARMYGDYRDPRAPQAVLELDLFLLNTDAAEPKIVFHRNYSRTTPLPNPSPPDLVAGYSRLAAQIFAEFAGEIHQAGVLKQK